MCLEDVVVKATLFVAVLALVVIVAAGQLSLSKTTRVRRLKEVFCKFSKRRDGGGRDPAGVLREFLIGPSDSFCIIIGSRAEASARDVFEYNLNIPAFPVNQSVRLFLLVHVVLCSLYAKCTRFLFKSIEHSEFDNP